MASPNTYQRGLPALKRAVPRLGEPIARSESRRADGSGFIPAAVQPFEVASSVAFRRRPQTAACQFVLALHRLHAAESLFQSCPSVLHVCRSVVVSKP